MFRARMTYIVLISLTAFLLSCGNSHTLKRSESELRFNSGEHRLLGDAAYRQVCSRFSSCPPVLKRADGLFTFTYGELIAFSGDFYQSPEQMFFETETKSWSHPLFNDPSAVQKLISGELEFVEEQMFKGAMSPYPDETLGYIVAFPSYIKTSLDNIEHFGWHNIKAYVRYHAAALRLAQQASMQRHSQREAAAELFQQAVFVNSFADHFLTDGFAAGHLRNPRAESLSWGKKEGQSILAVQALTKLLHDQDHLLKNSEGKGLRVLNARGDRWATRSDGELFALASWEEPHVRIPLEAVELSLTELLRTFESGAEPEGVYAAIELLPYLDPTEEALSDFFRPDIDTETLDAWIKGLGYVSKVNWLTGLNAELARQYFAALPEIMTDFRQHIRDESRDPSLQSRLPSALYEGMINLR